MLKRTNQPDGQALPAGGNQGNTPCCAVACNRAALLQINLKLDEIRADQQEILNYILAKQEEETKYLNALQTEMRVGISASTLLRCQRRGQITVARVQNKKKYFRESDVERLRKAYWRLGD